MHKAWKKSSYSIKDFISDSYDDNCTLIDHYQTAISEIDLIIISSINRDVSIK
jgi:hypothetical protein